MSSILPLTPTPYEHPPTPNHKPHSEMACRLTVITWLGAGSQAFALTLSPTLAVIHTPCPRPTQSVISNYGPGPGTNRLPLPDMGGLYPMGGATLSFAAPGPTNEV